MSSNKDDKQLSAIEKMAEINWETVDAESFETEIEELYINLYEIRKRLNNVIANWSELFLARLARSLQSLYDNQDYLSTDVQEELEQYFLFENIQEKIEVERNISWEKLLE